MENTSPTASQPREPFTPSEAKVIKLVLSGERNKDIAQHLVISIRTVESHMSRILAKAGCSSRSQLIARLLV